MTLILHAHPLSSYCWKVLIALRENGTDFVFQQLDLFDEAQTAAFARLWPIGKMPVLVDDGGPIVESSIIIEHLMLSHPGHARLIPADPKAALEVRMLDRIFDNYVMTPMQKIVFDRIRPAEARDPAGVADARELLEKSFGWLEARLNDRTAAAGPTPEQPSHSPPRWAAGEAFSLADCAAAPALHYADKVQPFRDRFPTLAVYLARLEARPSVARVLDEAAPYRHLFPIEEAA